MFPNINLIKKNYLDNGVALIKNFCTKKDLDIVKSAIQFTIDNPSPFSKKINNGEKEYIIFQIIS